MKEKKIIARYKKATFLYEIIETYTAGLVLTGSEIKSIRQGNVNFNDPYAYFKNNELYLRGLHIAPYKHAGYSKHDPDRDKKLLLNKSEILRLQRRVNEKGFTIIPLNCFISETGFAKVEIAVVKGKKLFDKRQAIKKRDIERRTNDDY
ncbi:MAG: SsrA-binding protein SmpB [Bacteroidales bacterium]|nr:SsrA-binding protein SmpB [Bacteroidales bacterium]